MKPIYLVREVDPENPPRIEVSSSFFVDVKAAKIPKLNQKIPMF